MKTRNWMMAFALLWTATWANDLFAQKHLDALIKRCETMKDVQIEEVYSKDKKTKKPERRITTIRFSKKKNPKLLEDFIQAFQQDKEAAYNIIENKENGKVIPSLYQYAVGTSDITYTLKDKEKQLKMYAGGVFDTEADIQFSRIEQFDAEE